MDSRTFRQRFLHFFARNGHVVINGAPLVPEYDASVLFTTAGMHLEAPAHEAGRSRVVHDRWDAPLVPYLLGEAHPAGKRLADVQKCVRTDDIMEVGDEIHLTFFEMLGNWSLGDYWKEEAIKLSFAFLTNELALDAARLRVTCFAGDRDAPQDTETAAIWLSLGIPEKHITFLPKKDNWWGPAGQTGPCGPDTEMFYDMQPDGAKDETPLSRPQRFWEIWNDVFMAYDKQQNGTFQPLRQKNVDTGMGLERTLAIMENVSTLYDTELFIPIMDQIRSLSHTRNDFAERIIADHTRAAIFILTEGIMPGNVDQPYVVRRLIRRAVRYGRELGIHGRFLATIVETVIPTLADVYPELERQRQHVLLAIEQEEGRFHHTLMRGEKEFQRAVSTAKDQDQHELAGDVVFHLYDTYGFPPELTTELAQREHLTVDLDEFTRAFQQHQDKSRIGAMARFRGGLSERSPETMRLHTATHLLHEALRRVLGPHVQQRGSNITIERLRFDFSHPDKLTAEQLAAVEKLVNEQIRQDLPIVCEEMTLADARADGAIGLFEDRYGDQVKVYTIGDFSKEICGGPHADRTGNLGHFRMLKEESAGAGVRRIKAVLEDTK